MKNKILDTETTGLNGEIVEIASVGVDQNGVICERIQEDLVKPEGDISFGAMATHHITPVTVKDSPL